MDWESSFDEYLEHLCEAVKHSDRRSGLIGYCHGLMLPIRRKRARRQQAGVPDEIEFATKPQIAIAQLHEARRRGAPHGIVLADAGYGNGTAFRDAVGEFGLQYAVGIQSSTCVTRT